MKVLEQKILEHNHDTGKEAEDNRDILNVPKSCKVDRLEVVSLRPSQKHLLEPVFAAIIILVTHRVGTHI